MDVGFLAHVVVSTEKESDWKKTLSTGSVVLTIDDGNPPGKNYILVINGPDDSDFNVQVYKGPEWQNAIWFDYDDGAMIPITSPSGQDLPSEILRIALDLALFYEKENSLIPEIESLASRLGIEVSVEEKPPHWAITLRRGLAEAIFKWPSEALRTLKLIANMYF